MNWAAIIRREEKMVESKDEDGDANVEGKSDDE